MILFADQYASHLKHLDQQSIKVVKARQSGRTTTISVSGRKFTVRARFPPSDCLNNEHGHTLRLPRCFICFLSSSKPPKEAWPSVRKMQLKASSCKLSGSSSVDSFNRWWQFHNRKLGPAWGWRTRWRLCKCQEPHNVKTTNKWGHGWRRRRISAQWNYRCNVDNSSTKLRSRETMVLSKHCACFFNLERRDRSNLKKGSTTATK